MASDQIWQQKIVTINKQVAVVAFGLSGGSLLSSTNRSFQGRSTPVTFMSMWFMLWTNLQCRCIFHKAIQYLETNEKVEVLSQNCNHRQHQGCPQATWPEVSVSFSSPAERLRRSAAFRGGFFVFFANANKKERTICFFANANKKERTICFFCKC